MKASISFLDAADGKKGSRFYAPRSFVRLPVNLLDPCPGRVHDPRCGLVGMFAQSTQFPQSRLPAIG